MEFYFATRIVAYLMMLLGEFEVAMLVKCMLL